MGCVQWAEYETVNKPAAYHLHSAYSNISSTNYCAIAVQPLNIRFNSQVLH